MLVPEKHLSRVSGLNHTVLGGLNLVGPMLGALAISLMPLHGVMLIDVGLNRFDEFPDNAKRHPENAAFGKIPEAGSILPVDPLHHQHPVLRGWHVR